MAEFVYFQEGSTYQEADLARFNALWLGDSGGSHLITSGGGFAVRQFDPATRTVRIAAGKAFVYDALGGYYAVEVTGDSEVSVALSSAANPRRDLIYLEVGSLGASVKIATGAPAVSPDPPGRPARSVALAWVDVPKGSDTFTVTPTRYTGQYRDQLLVPSPGSYGLEWGGNLPAPDGFRDGAELYDLGTHQRWTRTGANTWFTSDFGPWRECTIERRIEAQDGTTVEVSGELYVRESSTHWELSGQIGFSPQYEIGRLVQPARLPSGISLPTRNVYGATGQTYGATVAPGGVGRLAIMTTGQIEYGAQGRVGNVYISEQFSKSPHNFRR